MVLAYVREVTREDGINRKLQFRVRYYVEEACGKDGCTDQCMGFDTTGEVLLELCIDQMRNQETFNKAMRDGLLAHVMERHPFKHAIPENEIVLCPTSF
jgi:hypothetical protein